MEAFDLATIGGWPCITVFEESQSGAGVCWSAIELKVAYNIPSLYLYFKSFTVILALDMTWQKMIEYDRIWNKRLPSPNSSYLPLLIFVQLFHPLPLAQICLLNLPPDQLREGRIKGTWQPLSPIRSKLTSHNFKQHIKRLLNKKY